MGRSRVGAGDGVERVEERRLTAAYVLAVGDLDVDRVVGQQLVVQAVRLVVDQSLREPEMFRTLRAAVAAEPEALAVRVDREEPEHEEVGGSGLELDGGQQYAGGEQRRATPRHRRQSVAF